MNRSWIVMGLALFFVVGCENKGEGEFSEEQVYIANAGGRAWEKVTPTPWTAREYVTNEPPMDGMLIDALADPFKVDADWSKAEGKAARDEMLAKLDSWWAGAKGTPNDKMDDLDVPGRFAIVAGARILQARLMTLNGDAIGGFKASTETWDMVKSAFETAPGLRAADLVPTVLIAAEAEARLGMNPEVPVEEKEAALNGLGISIPNTVNGKVSREYFHHGVSDLWKNIKDKNPVPAMSLALDRLEGGEALDPVLKEALGSPKRPSAKETGLWAYEALTDLVSGRGGFKALDDTNKKHADRFIANWGVDVFRTPVDEWDKAAMKAAIAKSADPVGEFFVRSMMMEFYPVVESAMMAQLSFDAARIRLASEIVKQKTGAYPTSMEGFSEMRAFQRMRDPISGEAYDVDFANWTLKSPQAPVDKDYIFINQAIERGAKI